MKGGGSPALVTAKSGDDYHISSRNINRPRVVKIQLSQVVKIRLLFPLIFCGVLGKNIIGPD